MAWHRAYGLQRERQWCARVSYKPNDPTWVVDRTCSGSARGAGAGAAGMAVGSAGGSGWGF